MQPNPTIDAIEGLKAAGEELKGKNPSEAANLVLDKMMEVGGPELKTKMQKGQDWQRDLSKERQRLEKAAKKIESWQKKVQERLSIIQGLEDQTEKVNQALEKLQQKIVLIKKENDTIIYQIKHEQ